EVEVPILLGDLRMEDHLHEHVAELLAHVRTIQPVDGVEQFADLVDQATGQAGVRLFPIPRTASRGAQGGNGFSKTLTALMSPELAHGTHGTHGNFSALSS